MRTPEGWRFSHTGYRRTYETTIDLVDAPSFRVKNKGPAQAAEPSE